MKRVHSTYSAPCILVEALEPRIAPAALLDASKFTTATVGTPILLDASGGPTDFQGLSTGPNGTGAILLYVTSGKMLVYTSDLNGNGKLDAGEITGIAASTDSQGRPLDLLLFSDVHGDIATNLLPGHGVSALTDSDNNASNGRDGRVLLDNAIHSISIRTVTASDLDPNIPGNTVSNHLAPTTFSIFGNIYTGGDFGGAGGGLTIDTSGSGALASKFSGNTGISLFTGASPQIGSIYTGSSASFQPFHFTQLSGPNVQGNFLKFSPRAGEHGGDINGIQGASATDTFSIGTLESGNGGANARGGDISNVTLHGDTGGYQIIAGDGGPGATGSTGGSILNFNDMGSTTSKVNLHTGSGGQGLLGAGGAAGTATFASVAIAGDVNVFLGAGGNGFSAGGAGAGLASATFTVPEGTTPLGGKVITTYHAIGDVGDTQPNPDGTYSPRTIDFNGDGIPDAVFTSTNPDQIAILIGNGNGRFLDTTGRINSAAVSETIYLDAPGLSSSSVAIGDFNGDGRPDIAAASGDPNSGGGVYVFLNQIGDSLHNPLGKANFTRNPLGAFPFSTPLQSATPSLSDLGFFQSTGSILALTTGDFNGDGIADIGYVQVVHPLLPGAAPEEVVGVLFGSGVGRDPSTGQFVTNATTGHPAGSGYFYANPSAPADATTIQVASFLGTSVPVLKATSLSANNIAAGNTTGIPSVPEVLLFGQNGAKSLSELSVGLVPKSIGLGAVDTNRLVSSPAVAQVTLVAATLQDFSIQDVNGDGTADIVALSNTPVQFLVTYSGDGTGNFTVRSGSADNAGGDNAGVFLGQGTNNPPPATIIVAIDSNADGRFNEVAVLQFVSTGVPFAQIQEYALQDAGGNPDFTSGGTAVPEHTIVLPTLNPDPAVSGLGAYYAAAPSASNLHPALGYVVLSPYTQDDLFTDLYAYRSDTNGFTSFSRYLTSNGFKIFSGDGGNSTIGTGGAAGVIGGPSIADPSGNAGSAVNITFPAYIAYRGEAVLAGGNGGNGFGGGGAGGDIQGVTVRYSSSASILGAPTKLVSGNGGNGVSGDGGRGGNLSEFSIQLGSFFTAGNGGSGLHGGNGGSVTGNGPGIFTTSTVSVTVVTGGGGVGAVGGGNGGSITGFGATFLPVIGGLGGSLSYVTGPGGNAAGGVGGAGGSITDSGPSVTQNSLAGDVTLSTGTGGNGLIGGTGGAISNFLNQPTDANAIPAEFNVLSGNGGIGVDGAGGAGGAINAVAVGATGLASGFFSPLSGTVRVLAGNGGASYSGLGGNGGSITASNVVATSTPLAVASGAGGLGLTGGGNGGTVSNSFFNSAAQQFGKVLVIAGAGGDALAATRGDVFIAGDPDTSDLAHAVLAIGGATGVGGNGGNITNITQPASTATAVDLIAGNGGSTLNAGSPLDATTGVGMGGSIVGINIAGTVGAISRDIVNGSTPPIRAYNDLTGSGTIDETIAAFVANSLGGSVDSSVAPGVFHGFVPSSAFVLSDMTGNVGIVAGQSGQVKGGQAAADGISGSVQNVTASSIMSIVAGSVDRVAPVQVLSGITVLSPDGVLGADKSLPSSPTAGGPNGLVEYFDESGNIVGNLQPGFRLLDGAIFANAIQQPASPPLIAGPRVFSTSQG